ncbi:MAG: 5-methyltetrahydropteroyltriglutamate--homocysteine S-methyltransferase [Culicoidibacterales bacterium]
MTYSIKSSNIGYPRLGPKREWKKALENFWNKVISEEEFRVQTTQLRLASLKAQQLAGVDIIPVGDFSLYDHVLDTSVMLGVFPKRFNITPETATSLDTYFGIARGTNDAVASEMTKWFNTNYHYIVPELENVQPYLVENRPLILYQEAKKILGIEGKPVILGLVTFLKLGKLYQVAPTACGCGGSCHEDTGANEVNLRALIPLFLPIYLQIVTELVNAGVKHIQFDEPILATDFPQEEFTFFEQIYTAIKEVAPNTEIILQTYFDSIPLYDQVITLPVDAIGLDFINDDGQNLKHLQKNTFPQNKQLYAGVIDGKNIWRADLEQKLVLIKAIIASTNKTDIIIQPSNSLLHVPVTTKTETKIDLTLLNGLAFANEKIQEITTLATALTHPSLVTNDLILTSSIAVNQLNSSESRNNSAVLAEITQLKTFNNERTSPYAKRIEIQHQKLNLPLLPTTTIGSFPQSPLIRSTRAKFLKGEISAESYNQFIDEQTKYWIALQEELDIDVLVHGEFERNDMVEYFGEKLSGFITTAFGWVQSYGSRAVKPPIIYGDIAFTTPITVRQSAYAQSLTSRPVKGMLTAPITIINWSFVRDDIALDIVGNQIGLALRKEVAALEKAGIGIIQVDEPALREGLPLQKKNWQKYLDDAVYSFKLTTTGVQDQTQIHTHMCYANFDDIIETISNLDADVISIEASRSHGEIIQSFENYHYDKEIGLGVYDIHSPRVPSTTEIKANIERALRVIPAKQFWINPDCGLKTRKEAETVAALKHMVTITKEIRKKYQD